MYGRKADAIVGYNYKAATYCPTHLIELLVQSGKLSPAARDMREEDALDQWAGAEAIDRQDERTFDSDDFPKVILSVQSEDDTCDWNGHPID